MSAVNVIVSVEFKTDLQRCHSQIPFFCFYIGKTGCDVGCVRIEDLVGSYRAFAAAGVRLGAGSGGGKGKTIRKSGYGHGSCLKSRAVIGLCGGRCLESDLCGVLSDFQSTEALGEGIVAALCIAPVYGVSIFCCTDIGDDTGGGDGYRVLFRVNKT